MSNAPKEITERIMKIGELSQEIRKYYTGKVVRILDPDFNGQPFGSSRSSQEGKKFMVDYVFVEPHVPDVVVGSFKYNDSISIGQVEIVKADSAT